VYDAELSQRLSQRLLELGVYVIGFFYPVVPKGQARIRVQVSAQHTQSQLTTALDAFGKAGREVGVVS
jgi:glycine C-acetyltransferase